MTANIDIHARNLVLFLRVYVLCVFGTVKGTLCHDERGLEVMVGVVRVRLGVVTSVQTTTTRPLQQNVVRWNSRVNVSVCDNRAVLD